MSLRVFAMQHCDGAMESVFIRVICGLQLLCDGAMASSIQHPAPEFPAASVT